MVPCRYSSASRRVVVVAADLAESLQAALDLELEVIGTVNGAALEGSMYRHPMYDRESPVVIGGDYITTDAGTGLVHTAPGHGQEDYQVGEGRERSACALGHALGFIDAPCTCALSAGRPTVRSGAPVPRGRGGPLHERGWRAAGGASGADRREQGSHTGSVKGEVFPVIALGIPL